MRKRNKYLSSRFFLLVCAVLVVFLTLQAKISNLQAEISNLQVELSKTKIENSILSVSEVEEVYLISPSQDAQPCKLTEEDVLELSSLLGKVKLKSNGSQDYLDYDGGFPLMFRIIYKDGTQMEFGASSPFYIIDSVGYKSEYAPCDAISSLYWELLPKYDPYFHYLYRYRTE